MIVVNKLGALISKTQYGFEAEGVLNPATIKVNGKIHLYYRAVAKGNYSSIGYCRFDSAIKLIERYDSPILTPHFDYENHGIEDPRISKIDETYYLTFTAYDGLNAIGAYAISNDLTHFEKKGLLLPKITYKEFVRLAGSLVPLNEKYQRFNDHGGVTEKFGKPIYVWDKNLVFFPRRINGKLHFLHRIKPDIQMVAVHELEELDTEFWQNYFLHFNDFILLKSRFKHEVSYIGGGCPPIETEHGWLLIYHGVSDTINGYIYSVCVALLDIDNPLIELARLPYPLFKPEMDWEKVGYVNNVCFPTGTVVDNNELYIFYGAADEHVACASVNLPELLQELLLYPSVDEK
jgi:predicted GH43/DUF377 family glycosyl hydrolase